MNIKTFSPHGLSANCYALEIENEIALIDVGFATSEILEYVKGNKEKIKYILLTHNHYDHICGVEEVLRHTEAQLALHKADAENLTDVNYNLTLLAGVPNPQISADIKLSHGDSLPLGGKEIKVIHTPGHTLGGVCYVVDDIIFSGDTLFCGTVGRTDFLGGDFGTLCTSLKRLAELSGDYRIYAGHDVPTTLKRELETNPYFRM